ncbi:hypothetical protein [Tritonibacter mobilis]|nr:hypothetical protein [Tritonibacter mobilis]
MIQHIKTFALAVLIVGVSLTKTYADGGFCADKAHSVELTQALDTQIL